MRTKTIKDVPKDETGELVQLHLDAGASRITVIANPDGATCTVRIET